MHLARTWWSCLLYILCCGLSRGKPQSQNLCIFQWQGCFSREFSYQSNTSLKWKLFMQAELDLVIKNCHSNRKFLMRESWEEIWFIYGKTCCGCILKWLIFRVTIQCTSQPDLSCFFWSIENDFPRLCDKPPYFPHLSGTPPSFSCSHFSDVVFAMVEHLGLINQELCFLHCRYLNFSRAISPPRVSINILESKREGDLGSVVCGEKGVTYS